jgi:hypothetical protein
MRATFVLCRAAATCLLASAANAAEITSMRVQRENDPARLQRTEPHIALYAVDSNSCARPPCDPTASFFVYNPSRSGQRVTVSCTAYDIYRAIVAEASESAEIYGREATTSAVVFKGADSGTLHTVDCQVSRVEPTAHQRPKWR